MDDTLFNKISVVYTELLFIVVYIFTANSKATIWLAGDLNLPDVDWSSCCVTSYQYPKTLNDCFLKMTADFGLDQIVNFGTRNDSILDVFLTNKRALITRCEALPAVSDHQTAVYVDTHITAPRQTPVCRKILLWKRVNLGSLQATTSEFTTDFVKSNVVDGHRCYVVICQRRTSRCS